MHRVLFSAVIALILVSTTNAAPTASHAVQRANSDTFASLDTRGWNAGVVEARQAGIAGTKGSTSNQVLLMNLKSQDSRLQLQQQQINQSQLQMSNTLSTLDKQLKTLKPGSDGAKKLESKIKELEDAEKRLQTESKRIQTQLDATKVHIETVERVISTGLQ